MKLPVLPANQPTAGPVDVRRTATDGQLDCVLIGYNDLDIRNVEASSFKARNVSGAWRSFKSNTVFDDGERIPYMTLLNRSLTRGTGKPHSMHVAELPSLGGAYLKSFLKRRGFGVELINFFNTEHARLEELLNERPRVVAITTTFYVDDAPIIDIIKFVRARSPETKIVIGGPRVYAICEHLDAEGQDHLLRRIKADVYVFDSQGELTLARILNALGTGGSLDQVPNLIYTEDGTSFRRTAREVENNDLDQNAIDWRHFDRDFYVPTVQMRTARSCAFKCAFCRYPVVAGPLSLTSIEVVEAELRYLREQGVKNVVIIDDTFNVPLPRFKNLCRMMIKNDFKFEWFSYFRCGNADAEAFDLMEKAGCKGVFLGIESGDNSVLEKMNKFAKIERYRIGIQKLNERGILTFASLITGYPGETLETIQNTMDFIEESKPDFFRSELYFHDENSPIQERAAEFSIKSAGYSWRHSTMDWRTASDACERMYREITNSQPLPLYMFDFWAIPYLLGKGITVPQLKAFVKTARPMLTGSMSDDVVAFPEQQKALADIFRPS